MWSTLSPYRTQKRSSNVGQALGSCWSPREWNGSLLCSGNGNCVGRPCLEENKNIPEKAELEKINNILNVQKFISLVIFKNNKKAFTSEATQSCCYWESALTDVLALNRSLQFSRCLLAPGWLSQSDFSPELFMIKISLFQDCKLAVIGLKFKVLLCFYISLFPFLKCQQNPSLNYLDVQGHISYPILCKLSRAMTTARNSLCISSKANEKGQHYSWSCHSAYFKGLELDHEFVLIIIVTKSKYKIMWSKSHGSVR